MMLKLGLRASIFGVATGVMMAPTCGDKTTVVAADASAPLVGLSYGIDGTGQVLAFPPNGTVDVARGQTFCVFPSVLDDQGAARLEWEFDARLTCSKGNVGQDFDYFGGGGDLQLGSVGDTVFTGLYDDTCNPTVNLCVGSTFDSYVFDYRVAGTNFAGTTSIATGTVRILPASQLPEPEPEPEPEPGCPPGQVCCEDGPDGGCQLCAPSYAHCP